MVHEAGKTVAEADPEISEAIDFAAYYADRAAEIDPARFTPDRVVVVTPPWNFPVAIPLGGCLAALAAGAAVVIKPAPQVRACAEVGVAALHRAGIPADALQLVHTDEAAAGRRLITHPAVERVVLTGASETAALFRSWRPDLHVIAETSGKNALVITPAADPDLAVADLVRSAFGHAGQKCSAASLAILVGSVADPRSRVGRRFRRQLVDAVGTLRVGHGSDLATTMGPLVGELSPKLERALTTLDDGESWLVAPRHLGGATWTPGVRDGVAPGSWFHRTECFGPVLGLMTAGSLDEAIDHQNATGFGLTGGLHSLDADEIAVWSERAEVGNAYVNRHITGAIVQRQSFGGWKGSVVGPGAKPGGPNYVAQFGTFSDPVDLPSAPLGRAASDLLDLGRVVGLRRGPGLAAGGSGVGCLLVARGVRRRARPDRHRRGGERLPVPAVAVAARGPRRGRHGARPAAAPAGRGLRRGGGHDVLAAGPAATTAGACQAVDPRRSRHGGAASPGSGSGWSARRRRVCGVRPPRSVPRWWTARCSPTGAGRC